MAFSAINPFNANAINLDIYIKHRFVPWCVCHIVTFKHSLLQHKHSLNLQGLRSIHSK